MAIKDDVILSMQGQIAAQEYVIKFLIQCLYQLAPQSDLQNAMHTMLKNSIKHANFQGDKSLADEMRKYVSEHAAQIIDAGVSARPAK